MIMGSAALVVLVLVLEVLQVLVDLVVFRVALVRVLILHSVNLAALVHLPAHLRQTLQQHKRQHSHNRRHRVRKGQHHQ